MLIAERPKNLLQFSPLEGLPTLLLFEDSFEIRALLKTFLERKGYRSVCAETIEEACTLWETHKSSIELLLADFSNPETHLLLNVLCAGAPRLPMINTERFLRFTPVADPSGHRGMAVEKPHSPAVLAEVVAACVQATQYRASY